MILQLKPPLWMQTPRGLSLCHFLIDYGIDFDLVWVCFDQATGESWCVDNSDVRIAWNQTIGREKQKQEKKS